jgi:hypothetical protein
MLEEAGELPQVCDDWASFAPVLTEAMIATVGSFRFDCGEDAVDRTPYVLELGGGVHSTPMLAQACAADGISLITIESNHEWVPRIVSAVDRLNVPEMDFDIFAPPELTRLHGRSQYDPQWCEAWSRVIDDAIGVNALSDEICVLAFVDLAPHPARATALRTLLDHRAHPRMIVCHDTEGPLSYAAEHDRGYSRLATAYPRATTRLCHGRRPPATTVIDLRP